MSQKQRPRARLSFSMKFIGVAFVFTFLIFIASFFYFNFATPKSALAATETISSGSYIINMGVTPQTVNNGLRPYGMVYDLMVNYNVPIKWVIESTKSKDGTDFTYSGTNYKGGCFIVSSEYINSTITARITYWVSKGIVGLYTTSSVSVPVYATITVWPRMIIDDVSGNDGIITNYFDNAMITSAGYSIGTPSSLTYCHDLWANPHGDPTWATHGYLYNLATVAKSFIWMQCHAVSVTEGIKNTSSPFERLNFLTTDGLKCYSNNKCLPTVSETHAGGSNSPYSHNYPTDPIMQFMSTMDGASNGGSEQWYQPQSTGAWRSTTKLLVTTSDGSGTGQGVLMVYGPAFGDTTNGYVMYEAGHSLDNGSTTEKVAAQRAFFNFILFAGIRKQIAFTAQASPNSLIGKDSSTVAVTVSGGSTPYAYAWSSTIGGTFGNSAISSTYFKAPVVTTTTIGSLICAVTDACSRKNFISRPITITPGVLPIELKSFHAKPEESSVKVDWVTASEINNDFFTIERSADGISFEEVGRVKGTGNSTVDLSYSYVDENPKGSLLYYRLRQTDFDGKFETFDPVFVRLDDKKINFDVTDYGPNPFSDHITFHYTSSQQATFTLINQSGTLLRSGELNSGEGSTEFNIDNLEALPSGIYYLVFIHEEDKKIIKLLKT